MSERQNKTLQAWETSAAYWDKHRALITQMFAPLTTGLIAEARIAPGDKVLDIGGGAGEPSLTISGIVGSTGSVMHTDPAVGMLEAAQAEAKRRGLTNIQFQQCAGDELPFADNSFDAVVARLSVMFFADPSRGLREALRVTREGARVAFVVWTRREANPFFAVIADVVERFAPTSEPEADAPDTFRFALPGKLANMLKKAGGEDVVEHQLNFKIEAALSFEEFWKLRAEMSDTLRGKLAGLTRDQIENIKREVGKAARQYFGEAKMSFPGQALIIGARK
jgi:ubiquinone/menaquinone biosynthesis C-methylase UbiE